MALPNSVRKRIIDEATKYAHDKIENNDYVDNALCSYADGATAEATNAESIRLQLEAQDANVEILLQQNKELTERVNKLVAYINLVHQKANEGIDYWDKQIESNRYNNARNDQAYEGLRMHETERNFCQRLIDLFPELFSEKQWNAGKIDRPCPHCGKELNRDRNLCCRECGKEVENG